MKKIEIKEKLSYEPSIEILCGTVEQVAEKILALKYEIPLSYKSIEMDYDYEDYYGSDRYLVIKLYGIRDETDDEYKKRLNIKKQEVENKKNKAEETRLKELDELKRLKEKYPNL